MSRSGKDPHERLKTAKKRTASSARWLSRQINDPYVKQAKAEGWRSRAAFKLIELDERFALLKGRQRVVDLGIAPGGWSQVVRKKSPSRAWWGSICCRPNRSRA
jgi:23S rRNA (uridine2552-2'-O)-methyltransferase